MSMLPLSDEDRQVIADLGGSTEPRTRESGGTITDAFSNPWVSVPFAIASALAAGATPGTARMSQALNAGLGMGIAGEKQAYDRKKRQRLSEAMGKFANATTPVNVTKTGVNPETAEFAFPDAPAEGEQAPSDTWVGRSPLMPLREVLPKYQTVEEKPVLNANQRQYFDLIARENPEAASQMVGKMLFKEPQASRVFGSPEAGYHALNPNGEVSQLLAGVSKPPPTPTWRPFQVDLGDKIKSGMISSTGEMKDVEFTPKGAAPARAQSPEDIAKTVADTARSRAQTQASLAQAARAQMAIRTARDPKTPTDKLTTELAVALRDQKNARDSGDEEGLIEATEVVSELRKSLAKRATERNAGEVMDKLPDPKAHKGKVVRDTQTGTRMKSDGTKWVPQGGGPTSY